MTRVPRKRNRALPVPSSQGSLRGPGSPLRPLPERGPGPGAGGGDRRCSLPEADDSSVFVVGTVLYRNLGSFLALQRWAPRARGGRGRPGLGLPTPTRPRLSPRNTTVLNSKVISVTVKPPPRSLLTPLEIEFAHMYNVSAALVRGRVPAILRQTPRGGRAHPSRPHRSLERALTPSDRGGGDTEAGRAAGACPGTPRGRVGAEAAPAPWPGWSLGQREVTSAEKSAFHAWLLGALLQPRSGRCRDPSDQLRARAAPARPGQGRARPGPWEEPGLPFPAVWPWALLNLSVPGLPPSPSGNPACGCYHTTACGTGVC